jgi:hypothetical protein
LCLSILPSATALRTLVVVGVPLLWASIFFEKREHRINVLMM